MSNVGWIILGTIFIVIFGGAAGLLAVTMFYVAEPAPEEPPPPERVVEEVEDDPVQPRLRGVETPNQAHRDRRWAEMQEEIATLRAELKAERELNKPLRELYEKAKKGGMLQASGGEFEAGGPGMVVDDDLLQGAALATKLATKLGLEGARAKEFGETYEAFLKKVEALEKEHASVKKDGDTTTITIPRLGQAGDQLRREWDDYVEGALGTDEKQAYDKGGTRNRLLGARAGPWARTVTIKEAGGTIELSETGDDGKGNQSEQQMMGPAIARDMILKDYAHLLK